MPKKKRFCFLLRKMLDEEHGAGKKYDSLALSSDERMILDTISKIQKDEQKHFKTLKKIFNMKCG